MDDPGEDFIGAMTSDQLEALVEAMALIAFADGDYAPAERQRFAHSVEMLTAGRMGGHAFGHVLERVARALRERGWEACLGGLASRLDSPALRQVALILASDMAAADGILHAEERKLLKAMATSLGLQPDATDEVVDGFPLA
jgi:tellurite resistance protein